jgi:hypothetical protein
MTAQTKLVSRLGLACMAAAVVSGILQGVWEMARPILITSDTFAAAPASQRWGYAVLSIIKSAGFLAGLFGLFKIGTKRGWIVSIFMVLATLGAVFFGAVWLIIAATSELTIVYVLGGLWYQMVAPVALGIASLWRHLVSRWVSVWAIFVGILNSQIFARLGPAPALFVQGVIWVILGYMIYLSARRAEQIAGPEHVQHVSQLD